jgi:DNA polymerase-1
MAVDVELGKKQAEKLAEDLAELTAELTKYLPEDLPFEFNWGSGTHKSALIFGGTVKYEKRMPILDEEGKQAYVQKKVTAYYLSDGRFMPCEEYDAADYGLPAAVTYSSGRNKGEYKTKQITVNDLSKPKSAMREFFYTFPGVTEGSKRWETSREGVYSTSAEVIKALANRGIPFLEQLGKVEGLAKDLSTYYIVEDKKNPGTYKGMLTLVQATGIIHHMLNHTSTVTARFSSSNPNLQNLPKEGKSIVKTVFISRFPGGKIIQSDFTALEVYVQAVLTKCRQLIKDLQAGLDMHCARVATKEGCTYEEAVLWCKGDPDKGIAPREGWPKKRSAAKSFSFERSYGAGAPTISENNGIPLEEVKELIAAEEKRYPEITRYYEVITSIINDNSEATNKFAQHPDLPHLTCNFRKSHFQTPDGKLYTYRQSPAPEFLAKRPASKGGCTSSFSPTEIKNYVVQGEGGEWAKAAMYLAVLTFFRTGNFGGKGLLVNQVHDAVYADAHPDKAEQVAAALHACMEAASEYMEWFFDWTVPVPVPSETTWGDNMMEEGKMPPGFKERAAKLRKRIRELYIGDYTPSFER